MDKWAFLNIRKIIINNIQVIIILKSNILGLLIKNFKVSFKFWHILYSNRIDINSGKNIIKKYLYIFLYENFIIINTPF